MRGSGFAKVNMSVDETRQSHYPTRGYAVHVGLGLQHAYNIVEIIFIWPITEVY